MSTQLLTSTSALIEDDVREKAQSFVERAHDRSVAGVKIVLDDGSEVDLPSELTSVVEFVLHGLTQGGLSVRSVPDELTSTSAASLLGISRPTLMKLVADGELASHKVGAHHRFAHQDVIDLVKHRREKQQNAFDALRALDAELANDE